MAREYLTSKFIKSIKADGVITIADDFAKGGERGLYIEARTTGKLTFFWRRTVEPNQQSRFIIGEFPAISIKKARETAQEYNRKRSTGELLKELREGPEEQPMTFRKFWEEKYEPRHVPTLADNSQSHYRLAFRQMKAIHNRPINGLTRKEAAKLHADLGDNSKSGANIARAVLSSILEKAVEWGIMEDKDIPKLPKRFKVKGRERYLKQEEIRTLLKVLDGYKEMYGLYFKTLLFTGARRGEACKMRWDELDLENNLWRRVQKGGTVAPTALAEQLVILLRNWKKKLERGGQLNEWVFPSRKKICGHISNPYDHWKIIRKKAGLDGGDEPVVIHTLRHTHASMIVQGTGNLRIAQEQLGHASSSTTERYAHVSGSPVVYKAVNLVVEEMTK